MFERRLKIFLALLGLLRAAARAVGSSHRMVLAVTVGFCLLVASVRRGNLGQRMLAVRSNERSAAAATGALSLTKRVSNIAVDGTDARTLGRPRFKGQQKVINIVSGANTPILNVTVTGMRNSTQDVWTLSGFVAASAPRAIVLESFDGTVWDCVSVVSPGSATGVTVA